jgi:hypothetical protein
MLSIGAQSLNKRKKEESQMKNKNTKSKAQAVRRNAPTNCSAPYFTLKDVGERCNKAFEEVHIFTEPLTIGVLVSKTHLAQIAILSSLRDIANNLEYFISQNVTPHWTRTCRG